MATSIFHRYGGFASVSRIVSAFYERVLESPVLRHYFDDVDMKRLIDHQAKFIASVMGGPASYSNEHLERVHRHLGITDDAFAEAVEILREVLEDFDFDEEDIVVVEAGIRSRRPFIVIARESEEAVSG